MKKSLNAVEIESLEVTDLGHVTKGLKVVHPHFGAGIVVAIFVFPSGDHSIGVQFESESWGYKALDPQYAKLRRADSGRK